MADVSRGVSTTLGYVLNLGVAAILVTTLMLSAGTLVESQRDRATRTQLSVVGERVASDLESADYLARASDDGAVRYVVRIPARAVDSAYEVRVNQSGTDHVVLTASGPDVSVTVPFQTELPVEADTVDGGPFVVVYDPATDTLVIEDA
ncbi:MAG: hypothetical protein ABEJ88_02220 [Halobacterium sp.]